MTRQSSPSASLPCGFSALPCSACHSPCAEIWKSDVSLHDPKRTGLHPGPVDSQPNHRTSRHPDGPNNRRCGCRSHHTANGSEILPRHARGCSGRTIKIYCGTENAGRRQMAPPGIFVTLSYCYFSFSTATCCSISPFSSMEFPAYSTTQSQRFVNSSRVPMTS